MKKLYAEKKNSNLRKYFNSKDYILQNLRYLYSEHPSLFAVKIISFAGHFQLCFAEHFLLVHSNTQMQVAKALDHTSAQENFSSHGTFTHFCLTPTKINQYYASITTTSEAIVHSFVWSQLYWCKEWLENWISSITHISAEDAFSLLQKSKWIIIL